MKSDCYNLFCGSLFGTIRRIEQSNDRKGIKFERNNIAAKAEKV